MQLIDTGPEPFFEDVVDHMAAICHAPLAMVALNGGRQWINGHDGAKGHEAAPGEVFCAYTVMGRQNRVVNEAMPPAIGACEESAGPIPRAFIAVTLEMHGVEIGHLYVADMSPRVWKPHEITYMQRSARLVSGHFGARAALAERDRRIAVERELAEVGAMYHAVVSAMQEGVVVHAASGQIVAANQAALDILGLTHDQLMNRAARDAGWRIVSEQGEELDQSEQPVVATIATGRRISGSIIGVHLPSGELRWIENDVVPMSPPEGGPADRVVVTFRDITERRVREQQLADALRSAEQAAIAKQQFLANMSHEIRTPLNGVLGMAQVLERTPLSLQQAECVQTILQSGRGLTTLLNDVLDLSKIEAGKFSIVTAEESLAGVMEQAMRLFVPKAEAAGLVMGLSIDTSIPAKLSFDAGRVQQCVANLVSNAIKFTQRGRVDIKVGARPCADGQVEIAVRVSDTGIGMDAETIARLFQPFVQADGTTSRHFGGTGLGLSLVRRLSQLMGGEAGVTSIPGHGSEFVFTFMARAAAVAAPATAPVAPPAVQRPAKRAPQRRATHRLRVLLVDDNAINRTVARLFMQPHDMDVVEVVNGQEALERLTEDTFDVVLMDMHMPVMDGATAVRAIRASEAAWADVAIVALTADAMTGDRERFIALGMDGYLSKPLAERELIAEIYRVHAAAWKSDRPLRVA